MPPATATPLTVIEPARAWLPLNVREIWEYRDLLYFLIWKDLKVRYKQTVLGGLWAILQPVLTMIAFSVFFGRLGGIDGKLPDGIPYPIFVYAALIPWTYFAHALTTAANSLVHSSNVISKVFFPKLVLPLSSVVGGLVDLGIASLLLLVMMFYYGIVPTPAAIALPLFVTMAAAAAFGVGLWLSAFNVYYRDFRYTIPFMVQVWLLVTPVAYPSELVPERWRALYGLNPMAGVVEGFRWSLLGTGRVHAPLLLISVLMTGGVLLGGLFYFRKIEHTFADVV